MIQDTNIVLRLPGKKIAKGPRQVKWPKAPWVELAQICAWWTVSWQYQPNEI
jgi:hypothetical protein